MTMKIQHWCAAAMVAVLLALGIGAGSAPLGDVSSDGQKRLLATNTTASASWITAGRYELTSADESFSKDDWSDHLFRLGKYQGENRKRGVEITFFGVGAENATVTYRVWRVKYGFNPYTAYGIKPSDIDFDLICTGTATLGTCVLTADETVTEAEGYAVASESTLIADTITVTLATTSTSPKGISALLGTTGYGAPDPSVYSPANNTPAKLLIPDMGGGDLYLEIYVGTATSCNALVEAFE